mgnify:CR=1 FL=1|tara:strand:- start:1818 stop:2087 length:270 start_codon:yes stop_codon:yes gene_type:complete
MTPQVNNKNERINLRVDYLLNQIIDYLAAKSNLNRAEVTRRLAKLGLYMISQKKRNNKTYVQDINPFHPFANLSNDIKEDITKYLKNGE